MADLTPGASKLLAWWGSVSAGVSQRLDTASMWDAVRNAAANEGVDLAGVSALDMNTLRSYAASQRTAMDNLTRAGDTGPIDASMIGQAPWSRDLNSQNLAPKWEVRYERNVIVDGEEQTLWSTSTFTGERPQSIEDMRAQLEQDAADNAGLYGQQHLSVGRIQITAV